MTRETSVQSISIHAPHAGSDIVNVLAVGVGKLISIHAPHMGSDDLPGYGQRRAEISIHAPRTGSDQPQELLVRM